MLRSTPYILLFQYPDGSVDLARGKDGKYIAAEEGNQYLLREIGDRILEDGLIEAYQIALLSGFPKRKDDL